MPTVEAKAPKSRSFEADVAKLLHLAAGHICARLKSRIGTQFIYKSGERGYH